MSTRVEGGLSALRQSFFGDVITPDDDRYDAARRGFNALVARRPAVIARCRCAEDVAMAFEFARSTSWRSRSAAAGTTRLGTASATTAS